jgi:hypothetical protein
VYTLLTIQYSLYSGSALKIDGGEYCTSEEHCEAISSDAIKLIMVASKDNKRFSGSYDIKLRSKKSISGKFTDTKAFRRDLMCG